MNTTVKTAAVSYAAVAVPVGTTPVISAMIATVIVPVVTAAVIPSRYVGTTVVADMLALVVLPRAALRTAVTAAQIARNAALTSQTTMSADVASPTVWDLIPSWCVRCTPFALMPSPCRRP